MDVRSAVANVIKKVLADSDQPVADISNTDTLTEELRLDSLDLAVTVVGLEQELGVDPFRNGAPQIRTFGDLVAVYEQAVSQQPHD